MRDAVTVVVSIMMAIRQGLAVDHDDSLAVKVEARSGYHGEP